MTPPLPPGALGQLLKTLPPEKDDPFPHLANLTPNQILQRRMELTKQIRTLEQERQAIDGELQGAFSDAELRQGLRAPGGWILKQRSRTCWDYCSEVRDTIRHIQKQAQREGKAQALVSTYLCLTQGST
jgi:hypothetical protein